MGYDITKLTSIIGMFILDQTVSAKMFRLDDEDSKLLSLLLSPSWLSGLIAVLCGLVMTLGTITAFSFSNSYIQQQLIVRQQEEPVKPLTKPGEPVPNSNESGLQNSWPLLIIWAGVGLIVYMITAAFVHSLSDAEALRESLGYVNAKPLATLEIAFGHAILRVVAAIGLIILLKVFYDQVIPYAITASRASALEPTTLIGVLYAFLSFAIIVVAIHLQTMFLRLALGRPRIFSH